MAAALRDKNEELVSKSRENVQLQKSLVNVSVGNREMEEKLATFQVAGDKHAHAERALDVLSQVQSIWREMGASTESDEDVLHAIQNCLENACEQKLGDARNKRDSMIASIAELKARVEAMRAGLGLSGKVVDEFPNLISEQKFWEEENNEIFPRFQSAQSKSRDILSATSNIQSALGLDEEELPLSLQRLMRQNPGNEANRDLSDGFLSECEQDLSTLRVRKSEIIVENGLRQNEIYETFKEMNLAENFFDQFISEVMDNREEGMPLWWNAQTALLVGQTIASESSVPRVTKDYTDHLVLIRDSLAVVAKGHRLLSEGLQELIERAQQTLLSTVEGGHDAVEACTSFRDGLLRLPKLSKERIETCLSQISHLVPGVDAMIQSEIEALTVVWEALGTPTSDRGRFWETIDGSLAEARRGIFQDVLATTVDPGGWLKTTAQQGRADYASLDKKLFKLQSVHQEVEKLRAQQDAKSKVLSLDSEVRLLNAQLAEFEDHKCNKDRLLSRQTASSNLLREERYRKQMKAKFTTKLKQLSELLKLWNEKNSTDFDPNILSEDVRMLLQNASWIDQRKEFMHLRTTKSKRTGKRRIDRTGSSESEESPSPPQKKQTATTHTRSTSSATSMVGSVKTGTSAAHSQTATFKPTPRSVAAPRSGANKRKTIDARPATKPDTKKRRTVAKLPPKASDVPPHPAHKKDAPNSAPRSILSPRHNVSSGEQTKGTSTRNKRLTLPPFGHVLEQTLTPRSKSTSNQENAFKGK